ncbi:phosphomannomutase [Anopheles ziemanni]|uniref:phosphomannomutase n=1 Tax=Anopheles coustani TaxID=139045 RepID=UPI00265A0D75|nr:phosphomannomutase [Anopheles coustani]XP_058175291.1 phosphomannomutase [Anopheles ziemanni]
MELKRDEILLLFDVDGTLTQPRALITDEMKNFLYQKVLPRATLGVVGGSDLEKMCEQLNGQEFLQKFDYVFPENGLVQYEGGKQIGKVSIIHHLGEDTLTRFINFCLHYIADLDIPVKRGTFVEFRNGMLNICPIGRNCSKEERNEFYAYDNVHQVRQKMIDRLRVEFAEVDLTYSIGGQISFDVYPVGWDKTFCLRHVFKRPSAFREIHFFGDKTDPGGNDYEIYSHEKTIGHRVTSPEDTKKQLTELLLL